jgi:hypothetical protein
MRDPVRIDQMLELLRQVWARSPDLRLGQLVVNAVRPQEPWLPVFSIEDTVLARRLRRMLQERPALPDDERAGAGGGVRDETGRLSSHGLAALIADALCDAGVVRKEDYARAVEAAAEGLDLNDRPTLISLAAQGRVPGAEAERLLAGDEGRAEVLAEEARSKALGVNGVPAFFLNGRPAFSGAVEPRLLADAICRAREETDDSRR